MMVVVLVMLLVLLMLMMLLMLVMLLVLLLVLLRSRSCACLMHMPPFPTVQLPASGSSGPLRGRL